MIGGVKAEVSNEAEKMRLGVRVIEKN